MGRPRCLSAVALLIAVLVALLLPAEATSSLTASPSTSSLSESVTSPGTGWQFNTSAAWFPTGWNSAYTYTNSGSCLKVVASGFNGNAAWSAYYTTSTSAKIALAGGGTSCTQPTTAGMPISASSSTPTSLGLSGNVAAYWYVVVQPTVAVTSNVTITVTFKVSATASTFTITMSPGAAITVTITPSSTSLAEDVANPGTGWTFNTTATWFPSGWKSAYTYTNSGSCVTVTVTTSVQGWNLTSYYGTSPSTPINVALAQAGTSTCTAPGTAGIPISASSSSPTTVLSSQSGTQTVQYYVVVQPTVAVTSSVTVTQTFTAQ